MSIKNKSNRVKLITNPRAGKVSGSAKFLGLAKGSVTIKICPDALRVIPAKKRPGLESTQNGAAESIMSDPVSPVEEKNQGISLR